VADDLARHRLARQHAAFAVMRHLRGGITGWARCCRVAGRSGGNGKQNGVPGPLQVIATVKALVIFAASLHRDDVRALLFVLGGSLIVFLAKDVLFASLAFRAKGAGSVARDLMDCAARCFATW